MIFNLSSEYERRSCDEYYKKMCDEQCVVELTKKQPARTLSQNSYLHVILQYFASQYGCSLDESKLDYYKRGCNRELFERKKFNKQGVEVTFMRSSSKLNTAEMALSITRFRNWSSAVAGIYLPSANENEFLIHAKQEIERNKEFI